MAIKVPSFSRARVLVVGDTMLDRYWSGHCSRISPEAPVPIVKIEQREDRPGGAGNVALNVASLGAAVQLVGLVGVDAAAGTLRSQLTAAGVTCDLIEIPTSSTITKLRALVRNQQLLRLDFEDGFSDFSPRTLATHVERRIGECDVLVLSDYGKGALREVQTLIALARRYRVPVVVDPKGSDFSRYHGATVITPNFTEFEAVVGQCAGEAEIEERAEALRAKLELEALLVTRSDKGISLFRRGKTGLHRPTRAREIYDVTGAGDTVVATLAASLAAGADLKTAALLANCAAGEVVGKLGATSVGEAELRAAIQVPLQRGVVDEQMLAELLPRARGAGERIVLTNGCFDILHAGHITYLARARALGDRLIVAVNDDDSVRRLKGPTRPVNPLTARMAVLGGLKSIDWVLPFAEDTPIRLIERLLPDVLVKGGDWAPPDIVGYDVVIANGGTVHSLEFIDGCSTSRIIDAIRNHNG